MMSRHTDVARYNILYAKSVYGARWETWNIDGKTPESLYGSADRSTFRCGLNEVDSQAYRTQLALWILWKTASGEVNGAIVRGRKDMFSISLEFDDADTMREMADKLWCKHKITGEMHMKKAGDVWILELHAEKTPPSKVIEQLKSQQISFDIDE